MCSSDDLNDIREKLKDISGNRCGGAEIKSSRVGNAVKNRLNILKDLSELPMRYLICVSDKEQINKESGLKWRRSMYKFSQSRLFEHLHINKESIDITVDRFGTEDFMESFGKYLDKKFKSNLFIHKNIRHDKPANETCLQVSDFIGGCIHRCYEGKDDKGVINCISSKIVSIKMFPRRVHDVVVGDKDEVLDTMVANHCFRTAEEFIMETKDDILKAACVALLYDQAFIDKDFIYADELLRTLKHQGLIEGNKNADWLRNQVIAPLRDAGVLIAACSDGYKIPECREDVAKFVQFVEMKTFPYLNRLIKMRESLICGTETQYDLISASVKLKETIKGLSIDEGFSE
jgi:hypothetical protein